MGVAVMVLEVMSSDSKSSEPAVRCERCGTSASLETVVQPLGNEPGATRDGVRESARDSARNIDRMLYRVLEWMLDRQIQKFRLREQAKMLG